MKAKQKELVFVESEITGGHYAIKTVEQTNPWQNNMKQCMSIELRDTDVVADIGAYVGEYSMWAIRNGAARVFAYEPAPYSFTVLNMNWLAGMQTYNLAVVGDDSEYADLFISSGIGVTNSIVKSYRKADKVRVETIKYEEAVDEATVVKIDVEGAEYSYNIIQPQLRAIILEFHPLPKDNDWRWQARFIMANLERAGFKCLMRPTLKNNFDLTGSWLRS